MFWRRRRDARAEGPLEGEPADHSGAPNLPEAPEAPEAPDDDAIANDGPWEPDPAAFEEEAAWGPGGAPAIEAADALYGVTAGDDAVSRVVSLRLADLPGVDGVIADPAFAGAIR